MEKICGRDGPLVIEKYTNVVSNQTTRVNRQASMAQRYIFLHGISQSASDLRHYFSIRFRISLAF